MDEIVVQKIDIELSDEIVEYAHKYADEHGLDFDTLIDLVAAVLAAKKAIDLKAENN